MFTVHHDRCLWHNFQLCFWIVCLFRGCYNFVRLNCLWEHFIIQGFLRSFSRSPSVPQLAVILNWLACLPPGGSCQNCGRLFLNQSSLVAFHHSFTTWSTSSTPNCSLSSGLQSKMSNMTRLRVPIFVPLVVSNVIKSLVITDYAQ